MKRFFDRNKFHGGNAVKLLQSGTAFFSELESLIRSARHFLHIQMYIFDEDETGSRIIDCLKEAAGRGVSIYIVLDAYGSGDFTKSTIRSLSHQHIHVKIFTPIHTSFRFRIGRRLHHKIVLMDGRVALIGGVNISRKYEGSPGKEPWLDFAVRLEGPVCRDVLKVCEDVWRKKIKRRFRKEFHHLVLTERKEENISIRLLQNDYVRRNVEISRFYKQSIKNAQHSLTIVASYFLPGNRLRRFLCRAAQRGVTVKLLLSGESDVGMMRQAINFLYPLLLRNHIEIYEWQPSVMHGKMMVVDRQVTTVGSYNINMLSDYGSLELNVSVDNADFAVSSEERLLDLMQRYCKKINAGDFEKQLHWWNQLINWISYQLTRISLRLLFFFMRK